MINQAFITHASEILADTNEGLSGGEIVKYFVKYAAQYGINIPYATYPFPKGTPNKRSVMQQNLDKFTAEQQYYIIKELCRLDKFSTNEKVRELLNQLIKQYSYLSNDFQQELEIVKETKHWLDEYPESQKHYNLALEKNSHGLYPRNAFDDLRLALELLLKNILGNQKSLENQKSELGNYLKDKEVSTEIINTYQKVIDYFSKYQNENIKHNDKVNSIELEFIIELTTALMRFLLKLEKHSQESAPASFF